ncbi:MAG: hypothetical protein B6D63_01075 [Candidatus Latescibacteria bacterium 4484_7]|nr:MAG: hypothetical protein B6D63_01075 [Candidatus Latescibacteria bacterium 4484_7]RLE45574.1 MAG: hypothetical protein DRJ25_05465 [Candidatus Woesearchaeota archaeon]
MTPVSMISLETAKYTGIAKEFDPELLSRIAKMNYIIESPNSVLGELRREIYSKDIFDPDETRKVFLAVMFLMEDVIRKEKLLLDDYDEVVKAIDGR